MARMASLVPELTSTAAPPVPPVTARDAAAEAEWLFRSIGRNGDDVASLRRVILVPPAVKRKFRAFARRHPEGTWIEKALAYRRAVLEEFDKLTEANLHAPPPAPPDPADQLLPVGSPQPETIEITAL